MEQGKELFFKAFALLFFISGLSLFIMANRNTEVVLKGLEENLNHVTSLGIGQKDYGNFSETLGSDLIYILNQQREYELSIDGERIESSRQLTKGDIRSLSILLNATYSVQCEYDHRGNIVKVDYDRE